MAGRSPATSFSKSSKEPTKMPFIAAALPEAASVAEGLSVASTAAAADGTALSYNASMQEAKQSQMNAQAQAQAMALESQRQQLETQQAQMRTAQNQQRFRATQEADLSGSGFLGTTGSPLDIMASTYASSQRDLQDMGYQRDTNVWGLQSSAIAASAQGNSQASRSKSVV